MKGSSFFKILFALGLIAIFAMLYWSSSLQEEDLKSIRLEMKRLNSEISRLNQKVQMVKTSTREMPANLISGNFPNLLEVDPYFTQTLPDILGDDFQPKGTLKQATIGRPDNLHPFNGFRDVSNMYQMCAGRVGDLKFGQY